MANAECDGMAATAASRSMQATTSDAPELVDAARLCQVCSKEAFKYKCPRCLARTCSLACSQAHKRAAGCSGKRAREAFVARDAYDEAAMLSDYRLLEEVTGAADDAARGRATAAAPRPREQLPPYLQDLLHHAGRAGVRLTLMNPGMQRRRENSSRYMRRARKLLWHVELQFEGTGVRHAERSVDSGTPLRQVLVDLFADAPGRAELHHSLREFIDAGMQRCRARLLNDFVPANAPLHERAADVDLDSTLEQVLRGKQVLENPRFVVSLQQQGSCVGGVAAT